MTERKKYPSSEIQKTRQKVFLKNCLLCNKSFRSRKDIHNSHTIPQRNLEKLKFKNQGVFYEPLLIFKFFDKFIEALVKLETNEELEPNKYTTGIKDCLIFKLICSKCDDSYFKCYENNEYINTSVIDKENYEILNAIALKSYLYSYYRSLYFQTIHTASPVNYDTIQNIALENSKKMFDLVKDDVPFYKEKIDSIVDDIDNKKTRFRVVYDEVLKYRVSMAAHVNLPILLNIDGTLLQDIENNYCEEIVIVILPDKTKSRILVLADENNTIIPQWEEQFLMLRTQDKHKELLFALLFQKENGYVFSLSLSSILERNDCIGVIMTRSGDKHFDFSYHRKNLPDLLARKRHIDEYEKTYISKYDYNN